MTENQNPEQKARDNVDVLLIQATVEELQKLAKETTHDARNPVFRVLQIPGHMRN